MSGISITRSQTSSRSRSASTQRVEVCDREGGARKYSCRSSAARLREHAAPREKGTNGSSRSPRDG
eukprot:31166-Pelagococcus_subviridis.AAC.11